MSWIRFFIVNLALVYASLALVSRLTIPARSLRAIAVILIALATVVTLEIVLGAVLCHLTTGTLLTAILLWAALVGAFTRFGLTSAKECYGPVFQAIGTTLRGPIIPLAFLALVISIWVLWLGIRLPVYSWDGTAYHLLGPLEWWYQGNLWAHVPAAVDWPNSYPQVAELIFLWQFISLGADLTVDLSQYPSYLLIILSTYALGRWIGLTSSFAAAAAFVVACSPSCFIQARTTYVDLSMAGFVLGGIALILYYVTERLPAYLWLGTIAWVLAAGVKFTALPFLSVPIVLLLARSSTREEVFQRIVSRRALVALLMIVLIGGFWYWRNWVVNNNPIYPIRVQSGLWTILPGKYSLSEFRQDHGHTQFSDLYDNVYNTFMKYEADYRFDSGGFGIFFSVVGAPVLIGAFVLSVWKKDGRVLLILAIGVWLFYLVHVPNARYLLSLVAIPPLCAFYLANHGSGWLRKAIWCFAILGCLHSIFCGIRMSFFHLGYVREAFHESEPLSTDSMLWAKVFQESREAFGPKTKCVAYTGCANPYGLVGYDLRPRIVYVPPSNYDDWLAQLRNEGAEYLVLMETTTPKENTVPDYSLEREWVESHPGQFKRIIVGGIDKPELFQILPVLK